MVRLGDVSPPGWEKVVSGMEEALEEIEFQGEDVLPDWRKNAHSRKFDRELFEKYGFFKDIILHPKFQMVKHHLEEHYSTADFDLLVGDPLIPASTAVIILFMLFKRVSNEVVALAALFVFNVNPLYASLMVLLFALYSSKSRTPRQYRNPRTNAVASNGSSCSSAQVLSAAVAAKNDFDHILLGNDVGTLYTAALLARNGHRCLVLKPVGAPITQVHPAGSPCSVPLANCSVSKVERYQALLDIAQNSLRHGERVQLHPVGTAIDGFTSSMVCTRRQPTTKQQLVTPQKKKRQQPMDSLLHLRVGETSFAYDLCTMLPLEKSSLLVYLQSLNKSMDSLTGYLISKIRPHCEWQKSPLSSDGDSKEFSKLASSSAENCIFKSAVDNEEAVELLSSVAAAGACEGLPASRCSAYALATALSGSAQGVFYPAGGYAAVEAALVSSIEASGGFVCSDVQFKEIVLEEVSGGQQASAVPRTKVAGVTITAAGEDVTLQPARAVISGLGILCTYTKLLPCAAVADSTRTELAKLTEARPKHRIIFWISGAADVLVASDYYEVGPQPDATAQTFDIEVLDAFAYSFLHVWSPSAKDNQWAAKHGDVQVLVVEFESAESAIELKQFHFIDSPTTATEKQFGSMRGLDGLHSSNDGSDRTGPAIYCSNSKGDEATHPQHDDYISHVGATMKMSKSRRDKLQYRAEGIIQQLYPGLLQHVTHVHVQVPTLGGHTLSADVGKFNNNISATTEIENFFLTGKDLATSGFAGELQGGWVGANAVLGYTLNDLAEQKNIISDLSFISRP